MSGFHPYIGLQLLGVAPRTFEQLSLITTNIELHLARNPHLLATLKDGGVGNKLKKPTTKIVMADDVWGNNLGVRIKEPWDDTPLANYKPSTSSYDPKGKGKASSSVMKKSNLVHLKCPLNKRRTKSMISDGIKSPNYSNKHLSLKG